MPAWMRPFLAVVIGFAVPLRISTDPDRRRLSWSGPAILPPARAMLPRQRPAPGRHRGHGLYPRRQRAPARFRGRVRQLLRPDLGTPQGSHPAGTREPRLRHPRRVRVFRVFRGTSRESRRRLVRVRSRQLAHHRVEYELRRDRRLRCEVAQLAWLEAELRATARAPLHTCTTRDSPRPQPVRMPTSTRSGRSFTTTAPTSYSLVTRTRTSGFRQWIRKGP